MRIKTLIVAVAVLTVAIAAPVAADHTHERGATGPGGDHNIEQIRAGQHTPTPADDAARGVTGPGGQHNIDQIQESQP